LIAKSGSEGQIESYPTPDELWDRTFALQNESRDRFAEVPLENKSGTKPLTAIRTSPSSESSKPSLPDAIAFY
jgi:hypothetical protein